MKIKKDNITMECSKSTYESMFKRLGYTVIEEKKEKKVEEIVEEEKVENKRNKKK